MALNANESKAVDRGVSVLTSEANETEKSDISRNCWEWGGPWGSSHAAM